MSFNPFDVPQVLPPTLYRDWEPDALPPWLLGPNGLAFAQAFALNRDALAQGATEAIRARRLLECPEDALKYAGDDRGLEQWPGESNDSFRKRCQKAFQAYAEAGTDLGIVNRFSEVGITAVCLRNRTFNGDDLPMQWGRMWIVLTVHPWTSEGAWGDPGVYGDGGTWGSTALPSDVARVRRLVKKWKSSHAAVVNIIVLISGELWGYPTGLWSDPGVWGGVAVYWDGTPFP